MLGNLRNKEASLPKQNEQNSSPAWEVGEPCKPLHLTLKETFFFFVKGTRGMLVREKEDQRSDLR